MPEDVYFITFSMYALGILRLYLKRLNGEFRRRVKTQGSLPSAQAAELSSAVTQNRPMRVT